jgi:hypothetical protein
MSARTNEARGRALGAALDRVLRTVALELHGLEAAERHEFLSTCIDALDVEVITLLDGVPRPAKAGGR